MAIYTIKQLKELPSAKNKGIPMVIWATTGGTKGEGIKSGTDLRKNLADGMKEKDIDKLNETAQGKAVIDEYVDQRHERDKQVEIETDGMFDHEAPNGDQEKDYVADHHSGQVAEKLNE